MIQKDQELIAEAYSSVYLKEGMEDKNYIPSLEEIKDYLHNHYKSQSSYYDHNPDLLKAKVSNLNKTAQSIKQIIDDSKAETTEWNHKYAGKDGREPYTVWDDLYSSVSDDYKDLHGFRHRTTFAETPIIPMAMIFKDIQDEFRARRERRDLDWAGDVK